MLPLGEWTRRERRWAILINDRGDEVARNVSLSQIGPWGSHHWDGDHLLLALVPVLLVHGRDVKAGVILGHECDIGEKARESE